MDALSMAQVHQCLLSIRLPRYRPARRLQSRAPSLKKAQPPPAPVSHIAALPIELLQQILRENYDWTYSGTWTAHGARRRASWVAAVSLVSRIWHAAAVAVLNRAVMLWTPQAADLFFRTITDHPALVNHLRSITLPGQTASTLPWPWQEWTSVTPAPLLDVYSNILRTITPRRIVIRHSFMDALSGDLAVFSRLADTLTTLDVTLINDEVAVPDLHNLRTLHLHWHGDADVGAILLAEKAQYPQLRHLSLSFLTTWKADMLELLTRLQPTLVSLRCNCVLVLGDAVDDALRVPVAEWVSPLSDSLERLEVVDCEVVGSLMHMRKLRHLTLDADCFLYLPCPETFFPATVESVAFEPLRGLAAPPLSYARCAMRTVVLGADVVPNLRHVEVSVPVCHMSLVATWQPLAFLLKEVAAQRGRSFDLNLDVEFWHQGDSFDWRAGSPGRTRRTKVGRLRKALQLVRQR